MNFTTSEIHTYYDVAAPGLKQTSARELRGPCPIHNGKDANFSVNTETGFAYCHSQCNQGWDIIGFEMERSGKDFARAKEHVFKIVGRPQVAWEDRNVEAVYTYVDESGKPQYDVVRQDGKRFFQRRRNPDGSHSRGLGGVPPLPFRADKLKDADAVYVVEGEKDVLTMEGLGQVATCNSGGAGNFKPELVPHFAGKHITILPDNDQPGREHAQEVAAKLAPVAKSIKIVELPGLPAKGDVTDFVNAGGTVDQIKDLYRKAPLWRPDVYAPAKNGHRPASGAGPQASNNHAGHAASNNSTANGEAGESGESRQDRAETGQNAARAQAGSLVTRCLADIEPKPVSWLWPGRIARGKTTMIAGNPGLGKSQTTASMAAVVTMGGQWPVTREQCEPGAVLFLTAEDAAADTLRPRLEAAGADLQRIHFVEAVVAGYTGDGSRQSRTFSLEKDLGALEKRLAELGDVAAVIIDPISAYLGATDSHRNADVRGLLAPLSEMAARHNVAVIAVSHLSKAVGPKALMRVNGSLAFVAAARAAYLVTPDPADKERRLLLSMKNNLGKEADGLAFRIEGATVPSPAGPLATSRVMWEPEPVSMTADEALQAQTGPHGTSAVDDAAEWVHKKLVAGPMAATEIRELAEVEGFSEITLRRARQKLGIKPTKGGMKNGWIWVLPPKMLKTAEDAQQENVSTFGGNEHLHATIEEEL